MPAVSTQELAGLIRRRVSGQSAPERLLVGIAGPPGAGKSTVTALLCETLNEESPGFAAILPMDGYHYDDMLLDQLGRKARKGAPDTFDVGGFLHMLVRLKANGEEAIAVPVFDRDIEIARAGARLIARDAQVILIEGNYLLLRNKPWSELVSAFGMTVMVTAPLTALEARLRARWEGYGLPAETVSAKVDGNDMPNARFVLENSRKADHEIRT